MGKLLRLFHRAPDDGDIANGNGHAPVDESEPHLLRKPLHERGNVLRTLRRQRRHGRNAGDVSRDALDVERRVRRRVEVRDGAHDIAGECQRHPVLFIARVHGNAVFRRLQRLERQRRQSLHVRQWHVENLDLGLVLLFPTGFLNVHIHAEPDDLGVRTLPGSRVEAALGERDVRFKQLFGEARVHSVSPSST